MIFMYIGHDGRYRSRVLLSTVPTQRSRSQKFHIKVKMFAFKFIKLYQQDLSMNFICMWHGRYKVKVLLREIPVPRHDLEVSVTDLEFSYKLFALKFT